MTVLIVCRKCDQDGSDSVCKSCRRAARKGRYYADPEKARAATRAWRSANPDRIKTYLRVPVVPVVPGEQEAARVALGLKHKRDSYARHRDEIAERAAAKRDPAEERRRVREWRLSNPERARGRAPLRQSTSDPLVLEYAEVLYGDPCVYCGGHGGTIDHIVPLSKDGENRWDNLASACARCNSRKHTQPLLIFLIRGGD